MMDKCRISVWLSVIKVKSTVKSPEKREMKIDRGDHKLRRKRERER